MTAEASRVLQIVVDRLEPLYGQMSTGLEYDTPLQLVVATILSAQCTDQRVNQVTPALFARYPSAEHFAESAPEELESLVRTCGFYRNKAKNIRGAARMVLSEFDGRVPETMDELLRLPGVARKTANVVLAHAFQSHEGIAVDTHVRRLSQRLGLTVEQDPVKIERDLMRLSPVENWGKLSDLLIWHGRSICKARTPACGRCVLNDVCPSSLVAST